VTGFLLGLGAGCALNYLFLIGMNAFLRWMERPPRDITWGGVLPAGILLGLALAVNMLHPPCGD
jgi:hypothetical protein